MNFARDFLPTLGVGLGVGLALSMALQALPLLWPATFAGAAYIAHGARP